ncbi:MAG: formate dehydrogenase accessory sulfurtransferase FdhD [Caulobacteraceae bacterium]
MSRFSATEPSAAEEWRVGGLSARPILRDLPDEAAIGISYDGRPHVVLMATPADVEDLAVGFTLSERIAPMAAIGEITVTEQDEGVAVDIKLAQDVRRAKARARMLEGRSSCGLCGVQRLKQAVRTMPPVGQGFRVAREAIQSALAALEEEQALGRLTRAMHAAAWADASGRLLAVREDVGRHNALDKLVGHGLRTGLDPSAGMVVVTSRCSFEMVEKAAVAGFQVIVAISAPTALALRKAEEAGLTLVALARADGHAVFTRPERILDKVAMAV